MAAVSTRRQVAPPPPEAQRPDRPDRGGLASLWAITGVLGLLMLLAAWGQWVLSGDEFGSVPILGPDDYPTWRETLLRTVESISALVMVWTAWFVFVRPIRAGVPLGIDAKLAVACLLAFVTDGFLNTQEYIFAWNQHSIDLGSWSSFLPFQNPDHASRYAEALVWGGPMYTYFCIGVAIYGCRAIRKWRASKPEISDFECYLRIFGLACVFDFIVENAIIRSTQAYAFAQTPSEVTLWAGSLYQFPIYETVFVGILGVLFTAVRMSAFDAPDGVSFVERGAHRFRPGLQAPVRWLAVVGFTIFVLLVVYHLPFNWLGTTGESLADLPSYMQAQN